MISFHHVILGCIAASASLTAGFSAAAEAAPPPSAAANVPCTFKRGVNIANWLSQNSDSMPYAGAWFSEADVAWIAAQGFDHIRVPIDLRIWFGAGGTLDETRVAPFDRTLEWAKRHGLGVILDAHFIEGADFNTDSDSDVRIYTDPTLMDKAARVWRVLAARYAKEGDSLRFEVLNEPKAGQNAQLNVFNLRMLAAIRESNPTRMVYFPCNKWNMIPNIVDLEMPAGDPHVAATVHFYEPLVFTHQRASWVFPHGERMPAVPFPGKIPNLARYVPADNPAFKNLPVTVSAEKDIDPMFEKLAEWARTKGAGREILLGEFGVFTAADPKSTVNWTRAVRHACERHGFGWSVWAYKGEFPVRRNDGSPAPMLEGLMHD